MARKKTVKKTPEELMMETATTKSVTYVGDEHIEFEDTKVKVSANISLQKLKADTLKMVDIMESIKNEYGYKTFLTLIDEMEFMFRVAFLTDIGLHPSLDDYIKIMESMIAAEKLDAFYDMTKDMFKVASGTFNRMYRVWEAEYISVFSHIATMAAPVNELSRRILSYMGDDKEVSGEEVELYNTFLESIAKKQQSISIGESVSTINPSPEITKRMFQKKNISDGTPALVVMSGEKKQ